MLSLCTFAIGTTGRASHDFLSLFLWKFAMGASREEGQPVLPVHGGGDSSRLEGGHTSLRDDPAKHLPRRDTCNRGVYLVS
jgi:hypothetical protein